MRRPHQHRRRRHHRRHGAYVLMYLTQHKSEARCYTHLQKQHYQSNWVIQISSILCMHPCR